MKDLTEKIKVMQAYQNGSEIEWTVLGKEKWRKSDKVAPRWAWDLFDYRVAIHTKLETALNDALDEFENIMLECYERAGDRAYAYSSLTDAYKAGARKVHVYHTQCANKMREAIDEFTSEN